MPESSLNADERETVINTTDSDDVVRIWTAQPRYLGQLRRNPKFTETKSGRYGTTAWAEFTIPADQWSPGTGAKRAAREISDEERARLTEQLARVREGRSQPASPNA